MSVKESKGTLKNRKGNEKVEKTTLVEAEDNKKVSNKKIDTKDLRNLPVSLQRGKSNHKWLAMMTVLGALLLKLLNEYNNKKKNQDSFYTNKVDVFQQYSNKSTFMTYDTKHNTNYPFEFSVENSTLIGGEYVKYEVEQLFLQTWEDYHFVKKNTNKIGFVVESLDTKLLMFNSTQSVNHKMKFRYLIEQDLRILKYGKEFDISNAALGGLASSYNLLNSESLLKSNFSGATDVIKEQIIHIAKNLKSDEVTTLDLQALLQVVSSFGDNKDLELSILKLIDVRSQNGVSSDMNIQKYNDISTLSHFNNHKDDFSQFWDFVNLLKQNYTKTTNVTLPLKTKKGQKGKALDKLKYVDVTVEEPRFELSYCKLPTSILLALTKGYDQTEISQNRNLFKDVPDMKENYDYAMELVRGCYHIFMETSPLSAEYVYFNDGYLNVDNKDLVLSKYGSFWYKPIESNVLTGDYILESVYNAYQATKSRTFQLWIFEMFQHYAATLEASAYDETWFSHTLKLLYLSFLNEDEGIDHKSCVFTANGHIYPVTNI